MVDRRLFPGDGGSQCFVKRLPKVQLVYIMHVFHPIVSTGWFALLGVVSGDVGKTRSPTEDPQACASRIRRCFRVPTTQHVPHGTMQWRPALVDHTRPCDGWRAHFSSVNTTSTHENFSADFYLSITGRFYEFTADRSPGDFDAPFSASELSGALNLCHDSTPGQDGLPYRAFQSHLPWWRASLLFFNLVVPSSWKLCHVVPVFKHGDAPDPDQYRAISLASCAFEIFERLVHGRIAPRICSGLDECQGGFRWGADAGIYGLVDTLRLRHDQHTFCAFVDILKAFDTSWVEAALVRLHQAGVTGCMWRTVANFLCGTLSQVRARGEVSSLWVDTGIAQGRCSRHFCSTSWSTALQWPYDAVGQVFGSCPSRIFVSRVSSTQTTM